MATTRYGFSFEEMKGRVIGKTLASWVRKNLKARLFFGKSKTQFLGDLGLFVVVVVVGIVTPGMLCCGFLSWNHGPMGQGGRRTAPGLGPVTTPL